MKELWIHAGLPKTGTSALQVFFAQKMQELKDIGLDYMELIDISDAKRGNITSGNGENFARSMLNSNHEAYIDDINGAILKKFFDKIENSKFNKLLLSSEYFNIIPINNIENLKNMLSQKGVILKFIYYVRRQDQFLMSAYMQRVKNHGYKETPDKFILENYKNIFFLNYYTLSKTYQDILGKDNLYVYTYETTKNNSKGIIGHFLEKILKKTPDFVDTIPPINTSPNLLELKLLLSINKFNPRNSLSNIVIKNSVALDNSTNYQIHNIIPNNIIKEILEYFRLENEKFFSEFASNEAFDKPKEFEDIDLDNIEITQKEMIDVFAGLFVELDKKIALLENKYNKIVRNS